MKYIVCRKILLISTILFLINQTLYSQNEDDRWIFGIGFNAVDYFPTNVYGNGNPDGFFNEITNAEDHWNIGGPKISATRYLWKRLSAEGSVSFNSITKFGETIVPKVTYIGIDVNLQYNFMNPFNDFSIFALAGGGYTFAFYSGGTVNFGAGSKYWFGDKFGVSAQGMYKYNSEDYRLSPHFYYSFSLIYRLNGNGRSKKFLWRDGANCF
ncbi:hypothetical protein [Lutibacter sp.]